MRVVSLLVILYEHLYSSSSTDIFNPLGYTHPVAELLGHMEAPDLTFGAAQTILHSHQQCQSDDIFMAHKHKHLNSRSQNISQTSLDPIKVVTKLKREMN